MSRFAASRLAYPLRALRHHARLPGLGRLVMALARWIPALQGLPVAMRDGRVLVLDLREIQNMPYLFDGSIPFEFAYERYVSAILRTGDTGIDIGANIGWYTTLFAERVGPEGTVHAFEPSHAVLRVLRRTVARYPQVDLVEAALADAEGEFNLFVPPHLGNASLRATPEPARTERVRVTTLASFVRGVHRRRITLIKCDAEGAELSVVRGAGEMLDDAEAPAWLMEMNVEAAARFGHTLEELASEFTRRGYSAYLIDRRSGQLVPFTTTIAGALDAAFVPAWLAPRIASLLAEPCPRDELRSLDGSSSDEER